MSSNLNLNINDFNVSLTKANSGTDSNHKFSLIFPRQIQLNDHEITLRKAVILNSFPNISIAKGNSVFYYKNWAGTTRTVDLLSGTSNSVVTGAIFSYQQINEFLQKIMFDNGDYLVDEAGFRVYYLSIGANDVYGGVQITATKVPTSLPSGWSLGDDIHGGVNYNGASAVCFQLIVPNTPIQSLFGLNAGSYPQTPHVITDPEEDFISTFPPQITTTTSLILKCNLACDSEFTNVNNLLSTVIINAGPNNQITVENLFSDFRFIPQNTYYNITIEICDQDGHPLTDILDNRDNIFEINIRRRRDVV